ncbi:MAG: hypothetical protein QNI98_09755 [Woeseiaceae bacterium]|nr:hypothetical protein [Woeseiaceae bacterium]
MIQVLGQSRTRRASPRAVGVLLAVLLNLALIPCSMAIEVVEEAHDCCPPELKLEALECCELDDANVDSRSKTTEHDFTPDFDVVAASAPAHVSPISPTRFLPSTEPPDPPGPSAALYKQHCAYLK